MQVILSTNPNSSALSILITYRHLFAPDLSPPLEAKIWARLADTSSHVFSWQLKVRVVKIELRILFPHLVSPFLQTPPFSCSSRRLAAQVSSAQSGPSWQFPLFWASLSVSCHEKLNSIFLGEVWAGSAPEPSWQHGSTKTNETGRNMQWGVLSMTACALIITVPCQQLDLSLLPSSCRGETPSCHTWLLHPPWKMPDLKQCVLAQLSSLQDAAVNAALWGCFDHSCPSFTASTSSLPLAYPARSAHFAFRWSWLYNHPANHVSHCSNIQSLNSLHERVQSSPCF